MRSLTRPLSLLLLLALTLLAACNSSAPPTTGTPTPRASASPTATLPVPTSTPRPAPAHFTIKLLYQGSARPDDLAFDLQGNLLFSDFYHGTISRLNADGSVTVLLRNIAGPEGIVVLADGTMLIAEQKTNRILTVAPGSSTPVLLRSLPGTPSTASCKDGVDNIAYDPTTSTIIVPDSPTGDVYRMSLDGRTFTLLASDMARPVGAMVDSQGTIYVADECGGAVVKIAPDGTKTSLGGFGMPDDVAFDQEGNLLVIDLRPSIHALIRVNLQTGDHETLTSAGLFEPQGLLVTAQDHIIVSDDATNIIEELIPA
jgi:sugar lactone lactonase YvrE